MNRREAEDYVYKSYLKAEKYQIYDARDSQKRSPDLTRTILQNKARTPAVVVTGSKGKGSVANMISQILQSTYKVGLMTSPHLVNFCERFKINGRDISDEDFAKYMTLIQQEIDEIDDRIPKNVCVSPMGIQADLALTYFNANNTDFNVFECGKGARYDDVNNVEHAYAVINSIFLEHTRELGETIDAIADDKSFVIDGTQKCIYVAEQEPDAIKIIEDRASKFDTPVKRYGRDFTAENIRYSQTGMVFDVIIGDKRFVELSIPLMGEYQAKNCALAMALSLDVLGKLDIAKVKRKLTELDWQGRMEVISNNPFIMLDACINPISCANIKEVLKHLNRSKVAVIIGIPNDKDYAGVAKEMNSIADAIILTKSQSPHYVFTDEQCKKLAEINIDAVWTNSLEEALEMAKREGDSIVILGTTSVVSEVKKMQFNRNLTALFETLQQ